MGRKFGKGLEMRGWSPRSDSFSADIWFTMSARQPRALLVISWMARGQRKEMTSHTSSSKTFHVLQVKASALSCNHSQQILQRVAPILISHASNWSLDFPRPQHICSRRSPAFSLDVESGLQAVTSASFGIQTKHMRKRDDIAPNSSLLQPWDSVITADKRQDEESSLMILTPQMRMQV